MNIIFSNLFIHYVIILNCLSNKLELTGITTYFKLIKLQFSNFLELRKISKIPAMSIQKPKQSRLICGTTKYAKQTESDALDRDINVTTGC